jgi:hypothetical protein
VTCKGCGQPTGTVFKLGWDKLIAKPSTAKICAACKTLVALKMHPTLK